MSTPVEQQPPPMSMTQQSYTNATHSVHGSVGPFIGVLAVITFLGVLAGMIGRLCSGRPIMGYGQYDFEGWVETKCSSCIDGRIGPPPPPLPRAAPPPEAAYPTEDSPPSAAEEAQQEIREEGQSRQNSHGNTSQS